LFGTGTDQDSQLDFDLWFAKTMFQFQLAMVIQNEHLGHASVNPKVTYSDPFHAATLNSRSQDVFDHLERAYFDSSHNNLEDADKAGYPKNEVLNRINHARATGDRATLEFFLGQLSERIKIACRRLRNEKVVELEAEIPSDYSRSSRATTPLSGGSASTEDTQRMIESYDVLEGGVAVVHAQDNVHPQTDAPPPSQEPTAPPPSAEPISPSASQEPITSPRPRVPAAPLPSAEPIASPRPQVPVARPLPPLGGSDTQDYISILYEHAAFYRRDAPVWDKEQIPPNIRRVRVSFGEVQGVGDALSWKEAKRIAFRDVCRSLGISH
jgi:hypothetical protein